MKHQRIFKSPLSRITGPTYGGDGIPSVWDTNTRGETLPTLPEEQAWVPIENRPPFNSTTERVVQDLTLERDGWIVEDLSDEQIASRINQEARTAKQNTLRKIEADIVEAKRQEEVARVQALSDSEAIEEITLFPPFEVGKLYDTIGEKFQFRGQLYKTNIVFTGAAHQLPGMDGLDALFTRIPFPGEILPWKQPQGAHDAYQTEDRVSYEGQTFESTVDNNIYAPGVVDGQWVVVVEPVV